MDADGIVHFRKKVDRVIRKNIRWLTWPMTGLLVGSILLHKTYPQIIDRVGEFLGFPQPSILSFVGAIVAIQIVEQLAHQTESIENLRQQMDDRSQRTFDERSEAYHHVGLRIELSPTAPTNIRMIQKTGLTSLEVLQAVSRRCKSDKVYIKIMLLDTSALPGGMGEYFSQHHQAQVEGFGEQIGKIKAQHPNISFEILYYDMIPSVSIVLVDDDIVSLGMYRYKSVRNERGVMEFGAWDAPTLVSTGIAGLAYRRFANEVFDDLWQSGHPAPKSPQTYPKLVKS